MSPKAPRRDALTSSVHPNKLLNLEDLERARNLAGSGARPPRVLVLMGIPGMLLPSLQTLGKHSLAQM